MCNLGILQQTWKRLRGPISVFNIPKMCKVIKILGATRNEFYVPLRKDTTRNVLYAKEFVRRLKEKRNCEALKKLYEKCRSGWKAIGMFIFNSNAIYL